MVAAPTVFKACWTKTGNSGSAFSTLWLMMVQFQPLVTMSLKTWSCPWATMASKDKWPFDKVDNHSSSVWHCAWTALQKAVRCCCHRSSSALGLTYWLAYPGMPGPNHGWLAVAWPFQVALWPSRMQLKPGFWCQLLG